MNKKHQKLFNQYIHELEELKDNYSKRYLEIYNFVKSQQPNSSPEELIKITNSRIENISTSGELICIFRYFWLECDKLNKSGVGYINPRHFTVDYLEGDFDDLFGIIDRMPYYPIGIDKKGGYC